MNFYKHGLKILAALIAFQCAAYATPPAGVPQEINYQGYYRESGRPVTGSRTMQFCITNDGVPTVTKYWCSASAMSVVVSTGLFNVALTPVGVDWGTVTPYIEVTVEGDLLGREKIATSIYALHASTASYAENITGINTAKLVQLDGNGYLPALNGSNLTGVQATGIADGAVTTAKLAANAVTDAKVNLTTGAITSGQFGDDRVAISTQAVSGGVYNAAGKLVQMTVDNKLPALNGSNLTGVQATGIADGAVTTAKVAAGAVTDTNVSLTTGAITSGQFGDDRIAISTQAVSGGVYNAAGKLVQMTADNKLPALNGSNLTGVQATGIADGAVTTAKLAANAVTDAKVSLTTGAITSGQFGDDRVAISTQAVSGGVYNAAGKLVQMTADNKLPALDGSNLTGMSSGDASLAANQIFTGVNTFSHVIYISSAIQTTGGNTRGDGAIDLQISRADNTQVASGKYSVIGGGQNNTVYGPYSVIGGGSDNVINGPVTQYETISGGANNTTRNAGATVSGGVSNTAYDYAAVGGGQNNMASGIYAAIGGGVSNTASGQSATVPGGYLNSAIGAYSFAAGYKSSSTADGAFTWSDGQDVVTENGVAYRTWFKNRGGFLVTGSTKPISDGGFFVSGAGNVGIGTTNPSEKLEIVGSDSISNSANIKIGRYNNFGASSMYLILGNNVRNTPTGAVVSETQNSYGYRAISLGNHMSSAGIVFYAKADDEVTAGDALSNERMRITNAGNVGIGTTNPLNRLHVEGTGAGSAGIYLNDAVPGATANTLYNSGGALYWNGSAVGGSQTPWTGDINAAGHALYGNNTVGGNLTLESTSNGTKGNVLLNPNGGNVGIGKTNPETTLDVAGRVDIRPASDQNQIIVFDEDSGAMRIYTDANTTTQEDLVLGTYPNQANQLYLKRGGNIGIGTMNPTHSLHVAGNAIVTSSMSVSGSGLSGTTPVFQVIGGTMTVLANGNVGIGTTAPGATLDVNGTVKIAKHLTQANDTGGTLTSGDFGKTITVNSASMQIFILPPVTAADIGATITMVKLGTGIVMIQAADGTQIADSGLSSAGTPKGIYNSSVTETYATITLRLTTSTIWSILGGDGTWTTGYPVG